MIQEDGFVRLSLDEMLSMRLQHLLCGIDGDVTTRCGTVTSISGYTEWVGITDPQVSLGWDWRLETINGVVRYVRVGLPRSNVMLIDERHLDYGWQRNFQTLATVVDALQWRDKVTHLIS
ncbi:MAG TPA: DUF4902 domain-containing protein [Aquabacterium sp.]|uniref:DUF4902 domain-containing protein n=1 Tax=Aquabacterium sp. TaxID=1872578 RepID=UPI002E33E241|nr:DUF4902 domain-containing protein [Aquabacterium sp.]HEX5357100.1 DUF4902 domain-containing protein [Aquabacterium sp.]